jgi:endonuclease/exonuclease/phosphatase family metal-dependent hydrolase
MKRAWLAAGLAALATGLVYGAPAPNDPRCLVVASWNVENLFDAEDDPENPGDDEYTPAGWTRWTHPRYRHKLTNLAEVVAEIAPDILCLAEVENRRVLDDLARLLRDKHALDLPAVLHRDSGDSRGIDTAILSRFEPAAVIWLKPLAIQRDMIVADFMIDGRPLVVIANHWKSRYGPKAESDAVRTLEARVLRAELDRRLKADPAAAIVVAGDFNDNVDDDIPAAHAGFSLDAAAVLQDGRLLFNLASGLSPDERGTYFYTRTKRWNSFDMIAVSRGMLPNGLPASPWRVRPAAYRIHAPTHMRQEHGAPIPFRRVRTRDGWRNYIGYSDHFPVVVTVDTRP